MTRRKADAQEVPVPEAGAVPEQVLAPCQPGRGRSFGPAVDEEIAQPTQPEGEPDAEPAGDDGGSD